METYLSRYTLLLVTFNIVVTSRFSTGTKNHAYFSTSEDNQFIGDPLPVSFHKEFTGQSGKINIDESLFSSRIHLKFLPPVLDFKERYLGIPHHERVTIINLSCNRTILMSSISGSTVHFHSSFFQDKIIPPLGNTSFSVVFLGRAEGEIKSHLYIHTSEGSFKYQVKGEIIDSPYRVRSLSGVKLPLNSTYTPELYMHNPHPTTLQILEAYSSGNEFHLELPSGELGGPKHIWQIPAFFTKPIVRLRFHASSQKNHSAYVRLKLDKDDQVLMIPVDVEVGSVCGLYSPDDLINFGIGGTQDPPKKVKLYLKNSSKKPIKVLSVSSSPVTKALKIDFKPVVVPSRNKNPTDVAILSFDWNTAYKTGITSGKITIKSNQSNQKLTLRYQASVLDGGLEYDTSQIRFKSDMNENVPRLITLKNNFRVPVVITAVTLHQTAFPYFQIKNFSTVIIFPGETKYIFSLDVKKNVHLSDLRIESAIHISSNASSLVIPLLCYDGKLKKIVTLDSNDTYLDLGPMAVGHTKIFYFGLINENPIDVFIKSIMLNISDATVGIVAVEKGNVTKAMNAMGAEYDIESLTEAHLAARSYCVVQVSVPANNAGYIYGKISVNTEFESLNIGIKIKAEQGKDLDVLESTEKLSHCFMREICKTELVFESHFTISVFGDDVPNGFHESSLGYISSSHILPYSKMYRHYYPRSLNQTVSCFTLVSNSSGDVDRWLNSLQLPFLARQWDMNLLMMHYENYLKLSTELMKLPLWLNNSEFNYTNLRGQIMRPDWSSLASFEPNIMDYPPIHVGNMTQSDVVSVPLPSDANPLPLESDSLPVEPLRSHLIIEPTYSSNPDNLNDFHSRNNLSAREVFKLMGPGGYGQFKFGNRKPGSSMPLLFELNEKHLRGCEKTYRQNNRGVAMSVRRSFIAKNTGAVPINVVNFSINGEYCEGFGFRIINCQPFLLPAYSTKKIEIAFTPDFTLSKINRLLTVTTLDSTVNYTLSVTIPPYLLVLCSNAIKRPTWEPLVYYSAVSVILFLLTSILAVAFFESNRILRNTVITLTRDKNVQPVLDLRMIGSEVSNMPEQSVLHNEPQSKIVWTPNSFNEEQTTKENQKPMTENMFSANCANKCQILSNGMNCKKKSERTICKRFPDGTENYIEKNCWETPYNRTNNSQLVKPLKSSICITTEPYIPLTNIKTSNSSLQKSDFNGSKFEQPRFVEFQRRRTRKKSHSVNSYDTPKKKSPEPAPVRSVFEESESSLTTCESSCSDDGEKDVESMFFQSVRHHLQSKTLRGRHTKTTTTSPLIKRKKSIEKTPSIVATVDNEWDVDEDENTEKAIVVRNNRRSSSSAKQLKKQTVNYGKMRYDQAQPRGKQTIGERTMKSMRKEKTQSAKKRNERMEKRVTSTKVTSLMVSHEGGVPAIPSPPVWTASFSDVVAGTDTSYSSVVATRNNASSAQSQKHQLSICSQDSGSSCSGSSVSNFPGGWKTEYQDALEQQDISSEQAPVDAKNPLNNIWGNWSSLAESLQAQSTVLQSSANSLFTDGATQSGNYDSIWNDQNLMKVVPDHQEMENNQSYQPVRNEINWPVITSLWDPLYTPSSAVETPPPVWGSDVWGPPVSPSPNLPPPEEIIPNNVELEYDPFRSLSNIWAQHSPNIWKPPNTE